MIRATILAGVLALGACSEVENAVDGAARTGAKGVITEILATRFPAVPKELITPFTDCIIDNSKAVEIREYIRASVAGVTDTTVATVRGVLQRPETIRCVGGSANVLVGG